MQGFLWGAFSVVTVFWVFFVVPETKGLSLEQLDYLYANRVPTRKFKGYHFADDILPAGEKADVVEISEEVGDDEKAVDEHKEEK